MTAKTIRLPGFVDLHTHLREPSDNKAETIFNGTYAAGEGGFVVVADMPNNPGNPTWTRERLDEKIRIINRSALVRVATYAGSQPESDNVGQLALMEPDAIGIKFYADPTTGNETKYEVSNFREAANEWHQLSSEKFIALHSGPDNLEDFIGFIARDLEHPLHVCHVNSSDDVAIVKHAKEKGLPVTCGVCPHHLLMTSHDRVTHGTFAEMKPLLTDQFDAEKLMYQLKVGDIDIIETDFAPHSVEAKMEAETSGGHCYGVPGIEHVVSVLLYQVLRGRLSLDRLVDAFSTRPAQIMGLKPPLQNQVSWEMDTYRITEESVLSKAGWSPYVGYLAVGHLQSRQHMGNQVRMHIKENEEI